MARYSGIRKVFPTQTNINPVTPPPGAMPNLIQGYNLGTLGRGPLDKATCNIW